MTTLQLLGGIALHRRGVRLTGPVSHRKRSGLLALLALAPGHALSRDRLLAYLWPESPARAARHQLSSALYEIRRALGPNIIGAVVDELRLDVAALRVDAVVFEAALKVGDPAAAVAEYGGAFLDGFHLGEPGEFDAWQARERERHARLFGRALEQLAEAAEADGDMAGAVAWWQRCAAHEPYDSRVVGRLAEVCARSGNPAGALQHLGEHAVSLEREFGVPLPPELAELATALRRSTGASVALPSLPGRKPASAVPERTTSAAPGAAVVSPDAVTSPGSGAAVAQTPRSSTAALSSRHRFVRPLQALATLAAIVGVAALADRGIGPGSPGVGRALHVADGAGAASDHPAIRRLAVLPLANHAADDDLDYFVAGMHDALIAELSQIGGLMVLSRQSVLRFRQTERPLADLARELGVDAFVEGSVFVTGDSVRISVRALRADPEERLANIVHRGEIQRALSLQGEVAHELARALHARVSPTAEFRVRPRPPIAREAQQAYLRGAYELERATFAQAIDLAERRAAHAAAVTAFERAVALEPAWAAALARLAVAYQWLAALSERSVQAALFERSRAAARRALQHDAAEAEAHAALALVAFQHDRDWSGAEAAFRRAIELDPNAHHWQFARFLQAVGFHDAAIEHFHEAELRNPLSDVLKWQIAQAYACAGRHGEAIAHAAELEARIADGDNAARAGYASGIGTRPFIAFTLTWKGMADSAVALMERNAVELDSVPEALSGLAYVYARAGRMAEARALAARVEAGASVFLPAHLYAALGETERALDMVEQFLAADPSSVPLMHCSQTYRLLRHEPRMQAMARLAGMPPDR